MRVNLQTSPCGAYRPYNNILQKNVSFQSKKINDCSPQNSSSIQLYGRHTDKTSQDEFDKSFEEQLDEAYEEGYNDGKKFKGFLMGAGMAGIAFLQLFGIYNDYDMQNFLLEQQDKRNQLMQDSIERQIEILSQDMKYDHQIITKAIALLIIEIDDLTRQKDNLVEQINALPEDSEEAQALKEELQNIQEQLDILEQQYQDYIFEYYNNRQEESERNNYTAPKHSGPAIPA